MILKDSKGNEFIEVISIDEDTAMKQYAPVTHCLAVVMVGDEYLLGWNKWRKAWEVFGGCMEAGETMRECITRECREELGISGGVFEYIGLTHFYMAPNYFSPEYRTEYGGLYGIRLEKGDLQRMWGSRLDPEEMEKAALLKDIENVEEIAEIDKALLSFYGGGSSR